MLIDLGIIALLVIGIRLFREPGGARVGNYLNIIAMGSAGAVVLFRHPMDQGALVLLVFLTGSAIGTWVAVKVTMIQIPAMVAFQHGAGGIAAFLVSFVELSRVGTELTSVSTASGIIGIIVGAATFSGSMVASGKLANRFSQKPMVLRSHSTILQLLLLLIVAASVVAWVVGLPYRPFFLATLIVLAAAAGIVFSIRIGGADMPVLISFLNATAGFAAAFCGIVIQNRLLVACGATVAASGSILTLVMCRAMNRSLWSIFLGTASTGGNRVSPSATPPAESTVVALQDNRDPFTQAIDALQSAKNIIVIPGYGMALAHAQFDVVALAGQLEAIGKTVRFAIHPVAGRMPGHMNVLLAEADVDYEKLLVDLNLVNPEFSTTDAVLIVGACDVINPAAVTQQGTPISGMPILMAHDAKHIIVCNLDATPGYSGVENPLYNMPNTTLLFGDAKASIEKLRQLLLGGRPVSPSATPPVESTVVAFQDDRDPFTQAIDALQSAKNIIVIPGYGMALAHAQFDVVALAGQLEAIGKTVRFAIHPVAGRMPGHMNVLLAEADVDYEKLVVDLNLMNPEFSATDAVLIVGACDVINPAAVTQQGTPISGMPILMAHEAKHIIVCNLDATPGYSGVENPLYNMPNTTLLFGDAKASIEKLRELLLGGEHAAPPSDAADRSA